MAFLIILLVIIVIALIIGGNHDKLGEYLDQHITGAFEEKTFKLLEFNIENGGMNIDFGKVLEAIKLADADVVAIEEGYRNMPTIAKAAKYQYHDTKMQILSKYPIYRPADPRHHFFRYIEIAPGRLIVVANAHLTDEPYGPNALRAGMPFKKLTKLEKETRLIELEKHIDVLPGIANSGVPVFLTGDFNVPSHLDCKKGQKCFDWPVSKHLKQMGFRDSYRIIHPDPNKDHGHTWWVDREKVRGWNPEPDDIHDRIDYIYCAGPVKVIDSRVIGENDVSPWPSDHRAVLSTFIL